MGVPVYYSPYALPEPRFVPTIGIICLDAESLHRWLGNQDLAELERLWKL